MGSMGIQRKIAWFSDERSKPLLGTESWSGSLPRSEFGKQISKGLCHWKDEKAYKLWNRDAETRLREGANMEIEKKNRGMLERSRDLSKIRK